MANIKKNFNFRNGVQVDDDNLAVTAAGLVGIGTTIPTESLDVRGNVTITGFTSASTMSVGVLTITELEPSKVIGAGVSIVSGIITAQGTGIVTYFGDARNLSGMPTSQWEDKDVGLGFTSIYNTGGNVGVGTEDPRSTLQIGNNVDAGEKGVGISSVGNINATGIVTASSFVGAVTGDVTGNLTGNVTGNINSTGVSTTADLKVTELDVDGHANFDNVSVAGVSTFTGLIDGNGGANIDNVQIGVTGDNEIDTSTGNLTIDSAGGTVIVDDQLEVTGTSAFTGLADFNTGATLGNVRISVGGDNEIDTVAGGLILDSQNGLTTIDDNVSVAGITTFDQSIAVVGTTTTRNLLVTGVSTFTGSISANPMTVSNVSVTSGLGIGSTETPAFDVQVRKTGNAEIQVTSTGGLASISVGKEVGTGRSNTSEIRFGGGTGFPYSSSTSLDIVNYDTGNFNYHLSANNAGAVAGDFIWHKGKNNNRMMTLTGIGGSLGIGVTQPTETLHVGGNGFVAGNFTVDDTVITNTLNVTGGASFGNLSSAQLTSTLIGNVSATSGVSTFFNIKVTDPNNNFAGIGIKTDNTGNLPFDFFGGSGLLSTRVLISEDGVVGLGTDILHSDVDIVADTKKLTLSGLGVGVTTPTAAVDFKNAGQDGTGAFANRMYMYPPQVTQTQRDNLVGVTNGAVIYNTSAGGGNGKLQVRSGGAWVDLH